MSQMLSFSQFPAPPAAGPGLRYRSLEADGSGAILGPEGPVPTGATAGYLCDPLGDTGPAAEQHAVLMIVAFNCPGDRIAALEDWYANEHIRMLMAADGWLRAVNTRVRSISIGPAWTHIAFHELRNREVMDSKERTAARSTPWRAKLEAEDWFPMAGRWIYGRL